MVLNNIDSHCLEAARANPTRRPDWRWQRAHGVLGQTQSPPSRHTDGGPGFHWIRRGYVLLRNLRRCTQPINLQWLVNQHPDATWAYWLYAAPENGRKKALLEAYLLTGESDEVVAARFGIQAEIVRAYEGIFFNVRQWLPDSAYIEGTVLDPTQISRFGSEPRELLWKRIGYRNGIALLEAAVSGRGDAPRTGESNVESFVNRQAIVGLKLQGALAAVMASDSPEAQAQILRLYPSIDAIDRNQRSNASAHSQVLAHVEAMVSGFTPTVASRYSEPDYSDPRTKFELAGVELSAQELINLQHGIPPDGADVDSSIFSVPAG
jgi:hypothetical protein